VRRLAFVFLCACSSSTPAAPPKCDIVTSGDLDASSELATCASLQTDDAGTTSLVVDTTTAELGRVRVAIDISSAPSGGKLSPQNVDTWDAIETGLGDAGCAYQAGSDVVPHGNFSLEWTQSDAGAPHGTIDVTLAVHAPPGSSCGASDVEYLHITF
jgi:hypothetical protein